MVILMKKRLIVVGVILFSILAILGLYQTFALSGVITTTDNEYNFSIIDENTIEVPAKKSKTIYYKTTNTNKGKVKYGIGYTGSNIKVKYFADTIDPVTGLINYGETKFIKLKMKEFENHYFIGQVVNELRSIYLGAPYEYKIEYNFRNVTDKIYQDGRLRFFCNVPKWMEFLNDSDLTFGSRLHGNIAAVLAGTPALLVTKDSRTRELAEYHHLNAIHESKLNEKLTLQELVEQQDFSQIEKYQKQNFDRYVAFLKKNDIPNIFMDGEDPQETAFDRKIKQTDLLEGIVPVSQCSLEEIAERNRDYYTNLDEKLDRLSKKLNFTSDLLQKERIKNQKIATEPLSKKVVNKVKGFLK